GRGPVGRVELVETVGQPGAERGGVGSPVVGRAHRVDHQVDLAQAETGVEVGLEGDDLDVEVGVVGAERLDAELVVLAVAPRLGPLVAEVRTDVPGLPGRAHRAVLHVGAHDGRGALGAQGDAPAAL